MFIEDPHPEADEHERQGRAAVAPEPCAEQRVVHEGIADAHHTKVMTVNTTA